MPAAGAESLLVASDVAADADRRRIVEETLDRFGRVDILVNNAGVSGQAPLLDYDVEDWRTSHGTPMWRPCFFLAQQVLPAMREQHYGRIVNIASVYGALGLNASLYAGLLAAGRGPRPVPSAGVPHLERRAAQHDPRPRHRGGPMGRSRSTRLSPGMFLTEQAEKIVNEDVIRSLSEMTPVGRFGEPREIGYAVSFLASENAAFITGSELASTAAGRPGESRRRSRSRAARPPSRPWRIHRPPTARRWSQCAAAASAGPTGTSSRRASRPSPTR